MKELRNYSLLRHNTFGIEAQCRQYVEFSTVAEAQRLVGSLTEADGPLLILGGGSNLLLTGDFGGTVIHSAIKGIEPVRDDGYSVLLRVGSGEVWDDVVLHCVEQGWHGGENLSLIPGEVGATAVQNIGAYGVEVCELIEEVEAVSMVDGSIVRLTAADCQYGYRQSRFKGEWHHRFLITHVTYRLSHTFKPRVDYGNIRTELEKRGIDMPTAQQLRQVIIDIRRQKLPDPQEQGNAGSFFMNPVVSREKFEQLQHDYPQMPHYNIDNVREKIPAGWLIEQCGWKGRSLGRAGVHSRQALVLVNLGGAKGSDIVALCEKIRQDVLNKFGVEINPEVNIV